MDKIIEKKKGIAAAFTKKALKYWAAAALALLLIVLIFTGKGSALRVDGSALITGEARRGEFNDYIRVSGQVQPMTTVQISPTEGGNVHSRLRPAEFHTGGHDRGRENADRSPGDWEKNRPADHSGAEG